MRPDDRDVIISALYGTEYKEVSAVTVRPGPCFVTGYPEKTKGFFLPAGMSAEEPLFILSGKTRKGFHIKDSEMRRKKL